MDQLWVSVQPDAISKLTALMSALQTSEEGGILLGSRISRADDIQVIVWAALPAKTKENFSREFHYQHQVWRDLYQAKVKYHPDLEIVGWFRTSLDSVPTAEDGEIHNAFFPEAYQVLLLLNAEQPQLSIYHMSNGKLVSTEQLTNQSEEVSAQLGAALAEDQVPAPAVGTMTTKKVSPGIELTFQMKVMVALAACLTLITLAFFPIIRPIESGPQPGSAHLQQPSGAVQSPRPAKQAAPTKLAAEDTQATKAGTSPLPPVIDKGQAMQPLAANRPQTAGIAQKLEDTASAKPLAKTEGSLGRQYTVQRGDSLWKISETFYGTGFDFYKLIQANGIATPGNLYVGMVLIIPDK